MKTDLSDEEIAALRHQFGITSDGRGIKEWAQVQSFARAVIAADRAKRVPMTEEDVLAAFAKAHPQDHADMQDGSYANAVEQIGARNVYRRFENGIRAAEAFHGIGSKTCG